MLRYKLHYVKHYKKRIVWSVIALVALAVVILLAINFASGSVKCENFSCFQKNMKTCSDASYINDASDAVWKYDIEGKDGSKCAVNVKFLSAKIDNQQTRKLEGKSMTCYYDLGLGVYPEKDISKCHGILKEELQTLIIDNLHRHIIENLGKLDKSLNAPISDSATNSTGNQTS